MRCTAFVVALICHFLMVHSASSNSSTVASYSGAFTSEQLSIAQRTQRDIERDQSLVHTVAWGVSLNSIVFDTAGYSLDSLSEVSYLLDFGINTFMLDLYWNELGQSWQLCPAPFVPQNNVSGIQNLSWENTVYQCDISLTVDSLFQAFDDYLVRTNTNLDANFLSILLNLKSITASQQTSNLTATANGTYLGNGLDTLSDSFQALSTFLFTPSDLETFQQTAGQESEFPSTASADYKRITAKVISNSLNTRGSTSYNITSLDIDNIFFPSSTQSASLSSYISQNSIAEISVQISSTDNQSYYDSCLSLLTGPTSLDTFNKLSSSNTFEYVIDTNSNPFTNTTFKNFVRCGISPILNATSYSFEVTSETSSTSTTTDPLSPTMATDFAMPSTSQSVAVSYDSENLAVADYIRYSFWSWAPDQPNPPADNDTSGDSGSDDEDEESNGITNVAYQCVALYPDGWRLANCYLRYNYACQNMSAPNDWVIPINTKKSYFDGYTGSCPTGYNFTLPRTPIENLSLMEKVISLNTSFPVWIDLNDITVSGCFVSGGPYAQCPYQKAVTKSKLIAMTAPSFTVMVFLWFLMIVEKFVSNPIQTNRKRYWKKRVTKYYENNGEYEGVPS